MATKSKNNALNLIFFPLISLKVTLFFHGKLYRGNRALKVDARRFGAFDSPNCPPLATVEAGIEGTMKMGQAGGGARGHFKSTSELDPSCPGSRTGLLHCGLGRGDTSCVLNLFTLTITNEMSFFPSRFALKG